MFWLGICGLTMMKGMLVRRLMGVYICVCGFSLVFLSCELLSGVIKLVCT